jgi:large subunit ribosomal protein L29
VKAKEMRKLKPEDLNSQLRELKLELMKELSNVKMGRPVKNPGKIREIKKNIARILTIKRELKAREGKR